MSAEPVTPAIPNFEVPVRDAEGKEIERVQVEAARIDVRVRPRLLKEAVLMYQANKRVGTHSTKGRSEVWYTNKKPWRQKGTGRARAGTRRSPLWRGGGITFGPKPRDYSYSLPKKMKVRALRSALFAKFRDGEVIVVDGLKVEAPRTKHLVAILKKVGATGRCLIGTSGPEQDRNLVLSARNIPGVQCVPIQDFNTLDVLTAKTVILTREALARILEAGSPAKAAAPEGEVKA